MSTPDNHSKKAPQFAAFKPLTTVQNTNNCCCNSTCSSSPTLSENISSSHYSWKVSSMDCATCARKVENAMHQLAGMNQVQVLFATKKLVVDANNDIHAQVESTVQKAGYSLHNEQATNKPQASRLKENLPLITLIMMMAISWGLEQFNHPFRQLAFITTTLVGLYPIAHQALQLIKSSSYFAIETLMSIATIGALFIGTTAEAAMVLLLFLIGEQLEGWATSHARQGISTLMALKPETTTRLHNSEQEEVAINSLQPGNVIEVATGGHLPANSKLLSPFASFDESTLTRESIPVEHATGNKVPAGATSIDHLVTLEVLSEPGASAIDQILKLIKEAKEHHAPIEQFINHFSHIYTPAIMAIALLVTLVPPLLFATSWQEWIYKGLTLLLIGCPCALVISTPTAITSRLAAAAHHGALIKGRAALEQLGHVTQVAFDKTSTLTISKPRITTIHPATGISESELLTLAAAVKQGTTHPLAQAIMHEAQVAALTIPTTKSQQALVRSGIEAQVNSEHVLICTARKHPTDAFAGLINELESTRQTVVLVVHNDDMLGIIALQDTLHTNTATAISELNTLGVKGVILTSNNPHTAAAIARELGLEFKAGLLPEDKVKAVTKLNQHAPLAMVSDSINNTPAMKAATIGIAMGSGTDMALETTDAALTHNHLHSLVQMIELTHATHTNIHQNITIALGLKGIFLITTLLGMTSLWLAVLADTGATVLVTANALRLLHRR